MTHKGQNTRERILDKATEVVIRRGFGTTSVNDLIRATGVNRGSLYFHFPGKAGLGVAVLERAKDRFLSFVRDTLAGSTPGERLDSFLRAALKAHTSAGFVGGCLWGNTALEMSDIDGNERCVDVVREVFEAWCGMIQEVLAEAQSCGQVRKDVPAGVLARQVIATIEGGIMQSRLVHDPAPMRQCLKALRVTLELRPSSRASWKGSQPCSGY
jgi:TetR/AcrR family transcriptional regulator, transcriptional repressor for nem operon